MNRIEEKLADLKARGKIMLSPYITAGDPKPEMSVELMHGLVEAGADVLELGIPFSDPAAEGPVIQHAMERALAHCVSCLDVLKMVRTFRQRDKTTPVIVMGYLNPIEQYGYAKFAKDAAEVGVDGTILVDLPPEECKEVMEIWNAHNLYMIFLCSPTTTKERMELIHQYAKGYLYYVSIKGVTGSKSLDALSVKEQYLLRRAQTSLPLMVGFGIRTPEMAANIAGFADGVIVGAALIECIFEAFETNKNALQAGAALISSMRQAIDENGKRA